MISILDLDPEGQNLTSISLFENGGLKLSDQGYNRRGWVAASIGLRVKQS